MLRRSGRSRRRDRCHTYGSAHDLAHVGDGEFFCPGCGGDRDILLQGARIALADGPYTPSEHQTLAAVGRALLLSHEDTERLLAIAARTPS